MSLDTLVGKYKALIRQQSKTSRQLLFQEWHIDYLSMLPDPDTAYYCLSRWYESDLKYAVKQDEVTLELQRDLKNTFTPESKWYFATIGFDDKIITVKDIKTSLDKILNTPNINVLGYSVEKFRRNKGVADVYVHHHIHFFIESDLPKSKVIQFLYQKVKRYVSAKNFVDVKNDGTRERYIRYINLDKCAEKLDLIEMDEQWRKENDIQNKRIV